MNRPEETNTMLQAMKMDAFLETLMHQRENADYDDKFFENRLFELVSSEFYGRRNNKTEQLIRLANFQNSQACPEDVDFTPNRTFDSQLAKELLACRFMETKKNIVVMGPTGAGKSYFAQAIGVAACRRGFSTAYVQLADFLEEYHIEKMKGLQKSRLYRNRFKRKQLLIIDEFLLYPMSEEDSQIILRLLDQRRDLHPTIVISQFNPNEWIGKVSNGVAGEALADRIATGSYRMNFQSKKSLRSM